MCRCSWRFSETPPVKGNRKSQSGMEKVRESSNYKEQLFVNYSYEKLKHRECTFFLLDLKNDFLVQGP